MRGAYSGSQSIMGAKQRGRTDPTVKLADNCLQKGAPGLGDFQHCTAVKGEPVKPEISLIR